MSDRDLIAKGRRLLANPSEPGRVTQIPGELASSALIVFAVESLPALLDALESAKGLARDRKDDLVIAQARVAELEAAQRPPADDGESLRIIDRAIWVDHGDGNLDGLTGELPIWADEWAGRIVAAVNGQRPPLGYVVGTQTSDGWSFAQFYGGPREDRSEAEQELAAANEEDGTGVYWQLLEVREVQP